MGLHPYIASVRASRPESCPALSGWRSSKSPVPPSPSTSRGVPSPDLSPDPGPSSRAPPQATRKSTRGFPWTLPALALGLPQSPFSHRGAHSPASHHAEVGVSRRKGEHRPGKGQAPCADRPEKGLPVGWALPIPHSKPACHSPPPRGQAHHRLATSGCQSWAAGTTQWLAGLQGLTQAGALTELGQGLLFVTGSLMNEEGHPLAGTTQTTWQTTWVLNPG